MAAQPQPHLRPAFIVIDRAVNATTYAIFWLPAKLQNGTPTSISLLYRLLIRKFLTDYPGHGIDNNNTQYFSVHRRYHDLHP